MRERERERGRQTDRQREGAETEEETDRQKDRKTERQTERQTDGRTESMCVCSAQTGWIFDMTAKINLLLTECEVRTASYGPSFFLHFMAQARSARAMKTRKEKTRIHNLPYGLSKRG